MLNRRAVLAAALLPALATLRGQAADAQPAALTTIRVATTPTMRRWRLFSANISGTSGKPGSTS